jgi:hydrogenase/urease accessory protein HupE
MISAFGVAFWVGLLRPITSFDEFGFLLALSIWSTFNEPYARLWVLGAISAVPAATATAVALWSSGRQLSALPVMAALMIVTGVGGGARLKIPGEILVAFAAIGAWFIGTEAAQSVDGMSPRGFILGASLGPAMLLACFLSLLGRLKAEWRDIACRAVAISIAAIGMMTWTFEVWRAHSPMLLH